jgi:hypothetical protein
MSELRSMKTLRLRHIETTSFSYSEETMYAMVSKEYVHLASLGKNDVVLFRSSTGNQLMFVFGFAELNTKRRVERYLRSERLRLPKHREWDPMMLANYARDCGIELEGIKTFEQHLEAQDKIASKVVKKAKKKKP